MVQPAQPRHRDHGPVILDPVGPSGGVAEEVWPVGDALHAETVRHHLQATGERLEQELGDERL